MDNNSLFGFMVQSSICKKYNIKPLSAKANKIFESTYDYGLESFIKPIIDRAFSNNELIPIKCTTFCKDDFGLDIPYNFVLSDETTLSIRTNINGYKISPRIIGQAGYEKLNRFFGETFGREIKTQNDIKELICYKIDLILPVFIDHLFDADSVMWIFQYGKSFQYYLIKKNKHNIDYTKSNFSFTKNINEWNESTTLKYKGKSIAEIQVHKKRTFKFRFMMKNIIPLLED